MPLPNTDIESASSGILPLKVLIADDEPLARDRLRVLLSAHPEVEIVVECATGQETIEALKQYPVDLAFLDIQMPGTNGFEVVREVGPAHMPLTVFVTAYDCYAVTAFEVHAVDYLTKPIEPDRLASAITDAVQRRSAQAALNAHSQFKALLETVAQYGSERKEYLRRLLVSGQGKEFFVSVGDIEWIEAADYYVHLHVGHKTFMLRQPIRELTMHLDPKQFVRIHRSRLVNIDYVREVLRDGPSETWAVLSSGHRLRISRAGWQNLVLAGSLPPSG